MTSPKNKPHILFLFSDTGGGHRAAVDAIVVIDERSRILRFNKSAEAMFGHRASDMLGQPVEMLIPSRFRAAHPGMREGFVHEPRTRFMGAGTGVLHALTADGREVPACR